MMNKEAKKDLIATLKDIELDATKYRTAEYVKGFQQCTETVLKLLDEMDKHMKAIAERDRPTIRNRR